MICPLQEENLFLGVNLLLWQLILSWSYSAYAEFCVSSLGPIKINFYTEIQYTRGGDIRHICLVSLSLESGDRRST